MSETMDSVFALLRPAEALTQPVIEALRTMFSQRLISEIGNLPAWKLANEIVARGEAAGFPPDADPVQVASLLLEYMRAGEFVARPRSEAPPAGTFKVVLDKGPEAMNARALLALLAADASRYSELKPFIDRLDVVRQAERKTPNWCITNADGSLNVEATLGYLEHLARMFSIPRREVGGRRPMPLARVFRREERPLINPFAAGSGRPEQVLITGPIYDDFDLGNLPEETHLAYIWAAVTQHEAWPRVIDPYDHIPAAFAQPPAGRWERIIADYRAAKEAGDPSVEGLSRYASVTAASGMARGVPAAGPARDEDWYRRQLYAVAEAEIRSTNSSVHRGPRDMVVSIYTTNGSIRLEDTIVLESISTSNGSIRGTALGGPSCTVRTTNGNQNLRLRRMTWEGLYAEAQRRGLV